MWDYIYIYIYRERERHRDRYDMLIEYRYSWMDRWVKAAAAGMRGEELGRWHRLDWDCPITITAYMILTTKISFPGGGIRTVNLITCLNPRSYIPIVYSHKSVICETTWRLRRGRGASRAMTKRELEYRIPRLHAPVNSRNGSHGSRGN